MAERLEEDTLYLAATRPALFAGVPLPVAGAFLMLAGFVIPTYPSFRTQSSDLTLRPGSTGPTGIAS
jgi:type IV secretory pathway VirB3-like protein